MADQISVDQGTGGKDYPLVRPSRQLGRLIADMFLLYVDDHCEFVAPFHVSWLSGFGTAAAETAAGLLAYDITIRDAYDTVVFESADAEIVSSAWGDKTIVEWSNPEVGSICRVVFYNDALADWSSSFNPDSAVINPRVIQRKPAAVDKLIVETSTTDVTIDGDETVQYSEGYNIALKSSTDDPADGEQRGSTITVDCTPGAGLGRYPGCDPTPVLRRLAGVTPRETGDVSLTAQQCFRAELVPTSSDADSVTVQPGVIRIATSCGPCEKCEQFAAVYEAYRRLHLKYKALGRRAEAVRDQRKANILRWNTSIACRQGTTLRLLAVPIGACRLLVVGSLCNTDREGLGGGSSRSLRLHPRRNEHRRAHLCAAAQPHRRPRAADPPGHPYRGDLFDGQALRVSPYRAHGQPDPPRLGPRGGDRQQQAGGRRLDAPGGVRPAVPRPRRGLGLSLAARLGPAGAGESRRAAGRGGRRRRGRDPLPRPEATARITRGGLSRHAQHKTLESAC
jgi:hypothetical protein